MRLKYFLLILPILFWVGCEDKDDAAAAAAITITSLTGGDGQSSGIWRATSGCIYADGENCSGDCTEIPSNECRCDDEDSADCDGNAVDAATDESTCTAAGGNWEPIIIGFAAQFNEDGTCGRPPSCRCGDDTPDCDSSFDLITDSTSCTAALGDWTFYTPDVTYEMIGSNIEITGLGDDIVVFQYSNGQLSVDFGEDNHCSCEGEDCSAADAATDESTCAAAGGSWHDAECYHIRLDPESGG